MVEVTAVFGSALGFFEGLVGGLFGLYVILVVLRWYESKRLVSILKDIRTDLRAIGKHMKVPLEERETLIRKIKNRKNRKK